jgi:hypothetical protein
MRGKCSERNYGPGLKIYRFEGSQSFPARPSGKGRLEARLSALEVKKAAWWEVECGECAGGGGRFSIGAGFVLGGLRCDEILIALGGCVWAEIFKVNFGRAAAEACILGTSCAQHLL